MIVDIYGERLSAREQILGDRNTEQLRELIPSHDGKFSQMSVASLQSKFWLELAMQAGRVVFWQYRYYDDSIVYFANNEELSDFGIHYDSNKIAFTERIKTMDPEVVAILRDAQSKSFLNKEPFEVDYSIVEPTGHTKWISARAVPIDLDDITKASLIGISFDVTELKETTVALAQAREKAEQSSKAKSDFLTSFSHEVRTPLSAILGFTDLLLSDNEIPEDKRKSLEYILRSAKHLEGLVKDMLDIAKIEAGIYDLNFELSNVTELTREVVALFEPLAKQNLVDLQFLNLVERDVYSFCDPKRLRQVLLNLVSNAIKFNIEGGEVKCAISIKENRWLEIEVADTGIGISSDHFDRVFSQFDRLDVLTHRKEGYGLGLSISKHLCEIMAGSLEFTSELGVGSSFIVNLPEATDSPRGDTYDDLDDLAASGPEEAMINTRNIVYIEHNSEHVELLKAVCENLGISVCAAQTGRQGVDLVQNILPELVVMDISLPDMTGFEVMTILKTNLETANIPIIIVSGIASENKVRRMLALGAIAYLPKPLDLERLRHLINANSNSNTVRL